MHISIGATGSVIKGDILDANKAALEAKLRDIDACLYTVWNPEKFNGYGCWELRRRPETKSVYDYAVYAGNTYLRMEYIETGVNHVKDMPFLDYRILEWCKNADMWTNFGLGDLSQDKLDMFKNNIERAEKEYKEREKQKARDELRYQLMQDRNVIRDFRNRITAGVNPGLLGKYWGSK